MISWRRQGFLQLDGFVVHYCQTRPMTFGEVGLLIRNLEWNIEKYDPVDLLSLISLPQYTIMELCL